MGAAPESVRISVCRPRRHAEPRRVGRRRCFPRCRGRSRGGDRISAAAPAMVDEGHQGVVSEGLLSGRGGVLILGMAWYEHPSMSTITCPPASGTACPAGLRTCSRTWARAVPIAARALGLLPVSPFSARRLVPNGLDVTTFRPGPPPAPRSPGVTRCSGNGIPRAASRLSILLPPGLASDRRAVEDSMLRGLRPCVRLTIQAATAAYVGRSPPVERGLRHDGAIA